ncbi:helical backbone metal receptor [Fusibacter sp. 3D3]|uniref:helical backbone metal receptor n=1 Tax=Fusibacter sp. 3D3 TaxID=1048380 RepID=UPI000852DAEB|nr:helical backbone metal receptor [Fusibacter sp. 3D3]GAU77344.1 vitamin B12 ABC transporter, B12-binding component BtuF [Fusibacter sp. 3D3]
MGTVYRKSSCLLIGLMMLVVAGLLSFASTVEVNGENKIVTTEIKNGRTYISSEDLKTFGFTTEIKGQMIIVKNSDVSLTFYRDTNKVTVNDAVISLDSKIYVRNGVPYIPMKFFFETINYRVGWTPKSHQVTLYKLGDEKFPIVISDGDVHYKFKAPAKRVVSLAPSVTEILFAIGAGDTLVGRTLYCNYPTEAKAIQTVGSLYEPDLEGILDLEPEVVIAATHINEDVLKTLTSAKIQTLTQKSPSKINEIYTFISKLGALVDHKYEARALISSLKLKVDRVNQTVALIPESERKTIYYVVGTGKKEHTAGNGTFINEVLQVAGGINVATDVEGWSYSLEKLIEHNPSYLFGEGYNYDTMIASDNYKNLKALKDDHYIKIDSNVFSIPGPRVIDLGLKQIIHTLYPDYESDLNY